MGNNKFYTLIAFLFILSSSCSKKVDINKYSELLQINFPKDMNLVHYDTKSNFQDYSIHSIYTLSFNQKNTLLDEIVNNLCDVDEERKKPYLCWDRCGDFFSYEYQNADEDITIKVIFIAKNSERILSILEVKN